MMYRYNLDREARQRLLINHHVRQEGIEIGKDALVQNIKDTFSNPETGVFNLQQYDAFTKQRLPAGGVTEAGFERYLKNELGRQQLARMFGLPGSSSPPRARMDSTVARTSRRSPSSSSSPARTASPR